MTTLIAGGAAWFAYKQVGEARHLREAEAQPFVVVHLQPSRVSAHYVNLVIENIGKTLATDVRFTFEPSLQAAMDNRGLCTSLLVTRGLATMPPGMRVERLFDSFPERKAQPEATWSYRVKVDFKDYRGVPQSPLDYTIDLEPLKSGRFLVEKGIHDLAKSVHEIQKSLRDLQLREG